MNGYVPWILAVAAAAALGCLLFVLRLRRKSAPGYGPQQRPGPAPETTSMAAAMEEYLVGEMRSPTEWEMYEFIRRLPPSVQQSRKQLRRRVAGQFRISEEEAQERLWRVFKAIRTVKARANFNG